MCENNLSYTVLKTIPCYQVLLENIKTPLRGAQHLIQENSHTEQLQ